MGVGTSIRSVFGNFNGTLKGAAFDIDDSSGLATLRCNSVSSKPSKEMLGHSDCWSGMNVSIPKSWRILWSLVPHTNLLDLRQWTCRQAQSPWTVCLMASMAPGLSISGWEVSTVWAPSSTSSPTLQQPDRTLSQDSGGPIRHLTSSGFSLTVQSM